MGKFARSWALMKASANILRQDKELMLFPLLAGLASLVVIATFAWPVFTLISHHHADFEGQRKHVSPLFMLVSFLFYFVQYGVVIFFNVALASAALIRLDGGNPTLGDGIRTAMSKLPNIIGYALIAATVRMILRALQERFGFVGRIVVGLLGFGWTVATFLVVPVLAAQDVGPIDAVKRSATALKDTWGENLIGNAGIGVAGGILTFCLIFVSGILFLRGCEYAIGRVDGRRRRRRADQSCRPEPVPVRDARRVFRRALPVYAGRRSGAGLRSRVVGIGVSSEGLSATPPNVVRAAPANPMVIAWRSRDRSVP